MRMFERHKIRKTERLSGRLWDAELADCNQDTPEMKLFVPGSIESVPGYGNYRGKIRYKTYYESEKDFLLSFEGVSHYASVYVDDKLIGTHYCSYVPFSLLVRKNGVIRHKIEVVADNRFLPEYSLDIPNDYYSYGGITRDVMVEDVPAAYIEWVHFIPISFQNGKWVVQFEVSCFSLCTEVRLVEIHILLAEKETIIPFALQPGENTTISEKVYYTNVDAWNIESPNLYTMETILYCGGTAEDDLIDRVGFRTVRTEGDKICLNDKPIRIKGFCRHEDHPDYGCAVPEEEAFHDMLIMKDIGANSVRTVHYPNGEGFLDMCDELGMLVWEENNARGFDERQMLNPHFEGQCENVIREMITAHFNHPSIFIWGILNECASETEYGRSCYAAQYSLIRQMDQTRPCTSASCKFEADICQDLPDICSWNIYPYWYEEKSASDKISELSCWIKKNGGDGKPLIISEVGAGAIYGYRNRQKDIWSEDLQEEIIGKQLRELFASHKCAGMFIWQFADVRVDKEWGLRRPKSQNNKGIVDQYRRPKLSYKTVKEIFEKEDNYWD